MPAVIGFGTLTAVTMAMADYTGGLWAKNRIRNGKDEYERKERLRLNRRRPIEETLAEVGEGRCE